MNFDKFTIKGQEIIEHAITLASKNNNQPVECGHLLKALIEKGDNVSRFLLGKLNVNESDISIVTDNIIRSYPKVTGGREYFAPETGKALNLAVTAASEMKDDFVTTEHIFIGLLKSGSVVSKLLKDYGITENSLLKAVNTLRKGSRAENASAENTYNSLSKYAINLNERAISGKLDPVIGRDEEIRRILQILSRRTKNNPVLLGEPGVGKTAIAEGLAHRIVKGDIPENLKHIEIFSLDMGALIAGAKYHGEFEERLKSVVKEVIASQGQIILFIDEIHTLVGAGKTEGAMDAANILKPALARGDLRAIGATTLNEYQKYFEKDKALERRFQIVIVDEPDIQDTVSILRGLKERYESHHKVRIKDEAIIAAAELSSRYITERFLPDKAIDLVDEAASKLSLEMNSVPEEIDELNRKIKQLEIEREAIKREGDKEKTGRISAELSELGEKNSELNARWNIEKQIISGIQLHKKLIEKHKIEAEKYEREGFYDKVAELRYGKIKESESEIKKLEAKLNDISENNVLIKEEVDKEDIAQVVAKWTGIPVDKLIQSEKTKLLELENEIGKRVIGQDRAVKAVCEAVKKSRAGLQDAKRPLGTFIFLGTTGTGKTELAKALAETLFDDENHIIRIDMSEYQERHSVSRLIGAPPGYVGYEEGGQLTEAVRRKPYSVILLDEIEKAHPDVFNVLLQVLDEGRLTDNKGRTVNFRNTVIIMTSNLGSEIIRSRFEEYNEGNKEKLIEQISDEIMQMFRKVIRPEFLNRIDEIIMFAPLCTAGIRKIAGLQLTQLRQMLSSNNLNVEFSEEITAWLASEGYNIQYGARPLKRLIQKEIISGLTDFILKNEVNGNETIFANLKNNKVVFEVNGSGR